MLRLPIAALTTVSLLGAAECRAQGCQPYWTTLPKLAGGTASICALPNGKRRTLIAAGFGTTSNGFANPVQRWTGQEFVALGSGLVGSTYGKSLLVLDDQGVKRVFFNGYPYPNGLPYVKRWIAEAGAWKPVPETMAVPATQWLGIISAPRFSTNLPGIAGLYGLYFPDIGQERFISLWNTDHWENVGELSTHDGIRSFNAYSESGISYLVIAGIFAEISGVAAQNLARWDGQAWHPMGDPPWDIRDSVVYDDGTGPSLYLGFNGTISTTPLNTEGIARWSGTAWVSVGGGTTRTDVGYGGVNSMAVFDDGSGPALVVAGFFNRAGGVPALEVAKWDGHTWSALGAGISGFLDDASMVVANDGRGESLFILGRFSQAGGGVGADIVQWVGCRGQCYANCDNSTASPRLNVNDFMCFLDAFARRDPYANCTVDANINAADFVCFMNKFAAGCP